MVNVAKVNAMGAKRLTVQDYMSLADTFNSEWVGESIPETNKHHTRWYCKTCGNFWDATYRNLQIVRCCPNCYVRPSRTTLADYYELAAKRGFVFIDESLPRLVRELSQWRCSRGHEFVNSYSRILSGQGCQICTFEKRGADHRHSADYYHEVAKTNGLHWIGKLSNSVHQKTEWECSHGHRWLATLSNIRMGNGCPHCIDLVNGQRVSRAQLEIAHMVQGEVNKRVGRKWVDIVVARSNVNVAIEYDCWYWHGGREHEDSQRDKFLIENGYRVLRIRTQEIVPSCDQIELAINSLVVGNRNVIYLTLSDWGFGKVHRDKGKIAS